MTQTEKIVKYCAIAFAVILIVGIVGALLQAVAFGRVLFGEDDGEIGEMKDHEISGDIRNLKISLAAAELEIRTGEALSLQSNYEKMTVKCANGHLTVEDKRRAPYFGNKETVTVILTVPEGFAFDRVSIEAGAGNVKISDLRSGRFCMELGASNVEVTALNVTEQAEIHGGTGKLSLTGAVLRDLDMELGVGDVTMEAALLGECEIECGIGKLDISLVGEQSDYRVEVEKAIGEATVNGESVSGDKTIGNGKNSLEIHGGIGSISVAVAQDSE